jgi:hypothetical protein
MNFVIVVPEHVDLMPSEDGQLTETCTGNIYLQIESHWTVLTINNLDTSFGKCHFCYAYLFVHRALISFVLCSVCGRIFLFACPALQTETYYMK